MTGGGVNPVTGEVGTAPDLTEAARSIPGIRARLRELADEKRALTLALEEAEAVLKGEGPGFIAVLEDGTVVRVDERRHPASRDPDGCARHREALAALGLAEYVVPPPVNYGTVSAIRASVADLARAGVPLADLIREGWTEPVVKVDPPGPREGWAG